MSDRCVACGCIVPFGGECKCDSPRQQRLRDQVRRQSMPPHRVLTRFVLPEDGAYIIRYDDADEADERFIMSGARDAALRRYENRSLAWNAHLFVKIDSNSRDAGVPNAQLLLVEPSPEVCRAMIDAYEDASGDRLPDGDGADHEIVTAMYYAILKAMVNTPNP